MSLLKKRKGSSIDKRQTLAGVPVIHEGVKVEHKRDGSTVLKLKRARGPGFLDRFRPPVMEKRYELDEFGTFVIRNVDRRRTVLDIIVAFEKRFGMSHREAELGVVAFFKILIKRNVLSVVSGHEATRLADGAAA